MSRGWRLWSLGEGVQTGAKPQNYNPNLQASGHNKHQDEQFSGKHALEARNEKCRLGLSVETRTPMSTFILPNLAQNIKL